MNRQQRRHLYKNRKKAEKQIDKDNKRRLKEITKSLPSMLKYYSTLYLADYAKSFSSMTKSLLDLLKVLWWVVLGVVYFTWNSIKLLSFTLTCLINYPVYLAFRIFRLKRLAKRELK